MRVHVCTAPVSPGHPTTTLVVDGVLAVDAGGLGWFAPPAELARVAHVLLTHTHIDHVAGLPIFLDTVYGLAAPPPTVAATAVTLAALRAHVFNNTIMPDFVELGRHIPPFLVERELTPGTPTRLGRYEVTAHEVTHTVPTVAYVIDDGTDAVAVVTDTAPVPELIARLAATPRLRTVYLESSFPVAEAALAVLTCHLTTVQFLEAAATLESAGVRVVPIHVKPRYAAEITAELRAASRANVELPAG
jgi:ribonuclease BN (tRNA processing enzyme)